jgi:hypothetical protein
MPRTLLAGSNPLLSVDTAVSLERSWASVKEATLRDFFRGTVSADRLATEVREAVEPLSGTSRRIHIQDLPPGEAVTITPEMLVELCDAVLTGGLPGPALETIAFAILASDHLHWAEDDELVGRVLYDWASPEINWELTSGNVRMFRDWLTGKVRPPSEPDITTETLSGLGLLRRTSKVQVWPQKDSEVPNET